MTFLPPSWRSLSLSQRVTYSNHPNKVTKTCQVGDINLKLTKTTKQQHSLTLPPNTKKKHRIRFLPQNKKALKSWRLWRFRANFGSVQRSVGYPEMLVLTKWVFVLRKDVWPQKTELSTVNSSTDWRCLRSIKVIETSSTVYYISNYHMLSLGSPSKNKQLRIDFVMARFSLNNQAL